MSPCEIKVLLHIYVDPEPTFTATEAQREALIKFAAKGAIESLNGVWSLTALGAAWVRALCNANCPTLAYLDNNGNPL